MDTHAKRTCLCTEIATSQRRSQKRKSFHICSKNRLTFLTTVIVLLRCRKVKNLPRGLLAGKNWASKIVTHLSLAFVGLILENTKICTSIRICYSQLGPNSVRPSLSTPFWMRQDKSKSRTKSRIWRTIWPKIPGVPVWV